MRIVSDLERMGDLAEHIAKLARMRFPDPAVPLEVRPILREAGRIAEHLVAEAAAVIAEPDIEAAARLEAGIDITLLGRYYERFADHAVSVARRVVYLVTGERGDPGSRCQETSTEYRSKPLRS